MWKGGVRSQARIVCTLIALYYGIDERALDGGRSYTPPLPTDRHPSFHSVRLRRSLRASKLFEERQHNGF